LNKSSISIRAMSLWGYVLAYGALYGFATFGYTHQNLDGTTDTGMILVWVPMALVGSTLIAFKNRRLGSLKGRVSLADGGVLLVALVLIVVLPSSLGIVKGLALVAVFAPYMHWYFRKLEAFHLA
jgi:hypothetical protein